MGRGRRDRAGRVHRRAFLGNRLPLRVMPSCEHPGASDSEGHLNMHVYGSPSLGREHRHTQEVLVPANR